MSVTEFGCFCFLYPSHRVFPCYEIWNESERNVCRSQSTSLESEVTASALSGRFDVGCRTCLGFNDGFDGPSSLYPRSSRREFGHAVDVDAIQLEIAGSTINGLHCLVDRSPRRWPALPPGVVRVMPADRAGYSRCLGSGRHFVRFIVRSSV